MKEPSEGGEAGEGSGCDQRPHNRPKSTHHAASSGKCGRAAAEDPQRAAGLV